MHKQIWANLEVTVLVDKDITRFLNELDIQQMDLTY